MVSSVGAGADEVSVGASEEETVLVFDFVEEDDFLECEDFFSIYRIISTIIIAAFRIGRAFK